MRTRRKEGAHQLIANLTSNTFTCRADVFALVLKATQTPRSSPTGIVEPNSTDHGSSNRCAAHVQFGRQSTRATTQRHIVS